MDTRIQALKERVERNTRGRWTAKAANGAVVDGIADDIDALVNDPTALKEYAKALRTDKAVLGDVVGLDPNTETQRLAAEKVVADQAKARQDTLNKVADDKLAADKAAGRR